MVPFLQLASNHVSIERRGSKDDSQAGESKLVELLANKYHVKGLPTTLLITHHIKKREHNKRIPSLIDMEAISGVGPNLPASFVRVMNTVWPILFTAIFP